MATVFEALDLRLSRIVAVKVMHPGLDEDADIAARFDGEARAAALLSHPNVVAVFDAGRDDGRPYIVMEYVRGITLRQLITLEAPFPAEQALQLFEPIVAALACAHDAGLIHRDVKPENVLISERGRIKVVDFGLARNVTAASVAEGGVVIGTVSYISPELVTRGHASARSDVYSLGILLYELLTGQKPHRGATPVEVAYAHVHRTVPLPSAANRLAGPVPAFLDALVRTSTARTPAHRQTDAGVLLRQVRAARGALGGNGASAGALRELMAATTVSEAEHASARLPGLVGVGARTASSASPPMPGLREIRMTPGGTSSPGFDGVDDGPTYYADGPDPRSPYSPPKTRVAPRTTWVQSRTHKRRRLGVVLASLALIGAISVGGWWVTTGRLPVTPVTSGLAQSDAQASLSAAGLGVQVLREYSETVPAGVAIRTDPADGTRLDPGTVVIVYVSQGPQLFDVPSLKGKKRDQALRALTGANLTAGAITVAYSETVPEGSVVSQTVSEGTGLRRGTSVDFVLSQGREPITVADWTGKPGTEARVALTDAGLRVTRTTKPSATVAEGTVISQSPGAGVMHRRDKITLVVSSGLGYLAVPEVRRLDPAAAVATLQAAGFSVVVEASETPAKIPGTVVRTDPLTGNRAQVGSTITIYVG